MFDPKSRYYSIENAYLTVANGDAVIYKKRRFLPRRDAPAGAPVRMVQVRSGDRLDLIAGRALGDPLQYWRIADANAAMNPFDLAALPGAMLGVPMPR